jgi:hypothetical protein
VKGRTVEFPSVGTWTLTKVSEQNGVIASEPTSASEAQSLHSRCKNHINETTATVEATQAQETFIPQCFDSRCTVVAPNPGVPAATTAVTVDDDPAPTKITDRLPPAVDGRFEL